MSIIDQSQTVMYDKLVFRFNIIAPESEEKYPDVYVNIYYEDKPPPISDPGVFLSKNKDYNFAVNYLNNRLYAKGYINYNIYDEGAGIWGYFHFDYENEYADCVELLSLSENSTHPIIPTPNPDIPSRDTEPDQVLIQNVEFFDLFHFTGLRRPGKIPRQDQFRYIYTQNESPFYQNLLKAAQKKDKKKMQSLAAAYLKNPVFTQALKPIETNIYALIELYQYLLAHPTESQESEYVEKIDQCFGKWLELPIKPSEFTALKDICINGINALMVSYDESQIELLEMLILVLRLSEWIVRYQSKEPAERVYMALKALIILPDEIFDIFYPNTSLIAKNKRQGYVRPLGIGELMIVRERPLSYEAGEIARIENVMKHSYQEIREEDKLFQQKTDRNSFDKEEDQAYILHQNQDYDLGQAISNLADGLEESFLYTDGSKGADDPGSGKGLTKKYSNDEETLTGGWTIDVKPNGNYTSQAINFAKNITGKVSRKLRERRHKSSNKLVQKEKALLNKRVFDNTDNSENITAIYRWVNKVSEARLINQGHRLIIEFVVPDPAENFVGDKQDELRPISPTEELLKNLSYTDMTPELYRELASHYPVDTLLTPPKPYQYTSVSLQKHPLSLQTIAKIPEGYQATKAYVSAVLGKGKLEGFVGSSPFSSEKKDEIASQKKTEKGKTKSLITEESSSTGNEPVYQPIPPDLPSEIQSYTKEIPLIPMSNPSSPTADKDPSPINYPIDQSLPLSVLSTSDFFNVNIDILCTIKQDYMLDWQLRAYRSIVEAYEKQEIIETDSYEEEQERKRERQIVIEQLRIASTQQLLQIVEPKPSTWEKEDFTRFIKQAFLWEELVYWLYDTSPFNNPGVTLDWTDNYQEKDKLPDFNQFLHAKAAKIHVAVKEGFEQDALFLIWSQGQQWAGLDMDAPIKEHYLFYANELLFDHAEELKEEIEIKSWKIRTPTHMQILQQDGRLPDFT